MEVALCQAQSPAEFWFKVGDIFKGLFNPPSFLGTGKPHGIREATIPRGKSSRFKSSRFRKNERFIPNRTQ